jgi:hypothetical protein
VSRGRENVKIIESGELVPLRGPDDVMLHGRFESGAAVSVHMRGGQPLGMATAGTGFRLEMVGTDGTLSVAGDGPFAMVLSDLSVTGAHGIQGPLLPMPLPAKYQPKAALPAMVMNMAETYAMVADDLRNGTSFTANIDAGLAIHHLLATIGRADSSGKRESVA